MEEETPVGWRRKPQYDGKGRCNTMVGEMGGGDGIV